MNKSLRIAKTVSILLSPVVVFVFYLIYNYYIFGSRDTLNPFLSAAFCVIAIAICVAVEKVYDKLLARYYEATENGLVCFNGSEIISYSWKAFRRVRYRPGRFDKYLPVCFEIADNEQELWLSNYTEELADLIREILRLVRPYAVIDKEVYEILGCNE